MAKKKKSKKKPRGGRKQAAPRGQQRADGGSSGAGAAQPPAAQPPAAQPPAAQPPAAQPPAAQPPAAWPASASPRPAAAPTAPPATPALPPRSDRPPRPSDPPAEGAPPLVSICIPSYNRAHLLPDAIESALRQTWPHFEIVIVDDGSTDETSAVARAYQDRDRRIRYYRKGQNSGRSETRNLCISRAVGEYVLWLADDDVLVEDTLERYVGVLDEDPTLDVVYGNLQLFEVVGDERVYLDRFEAEDWTNRKDDMVGAVLQGSVVPDGGTLIRRQFYVDLGFDPEFVRAQDYEFWTRLVGQARFHKIDGTVYYYRKHETNVSFGRGIDLSYDSKIIRRHLTRHPLERLFPKLNWQHDDQARELAWLRVARYLETYQDPHNIRRFLGAIPGLYRYAEGVERLADAYIMTGDLDAARALADAYAAWAPRGDEVVDRTRAHAADVESARRAVDEALSRGDVDAAGRSLNTLAESRGVCLDLCVGWTRAFLRNSEPQPAYDFALRAVRLAPERDDLVQRAIEIGRRLGRSDTRDLAAAMRDRLCSVFIELEPQDPRPTPPPDVPTEGESVAFVIPTDGAAPGLRAALKTARAQMWAPLEIVVADISADGTARAICEGEEDARVRWVSAAGSTLPTARNAAIAATNASLIAHGGCGATATSDHVPRMVRALRADDDTRWAYADTWLCEVSEIGGELVAGERIGSHAEDFSLDRVLLHPLIPLESTLHERTLWDEVGGIEGDHGRYAEWDLVTRLALASTPRHLGLASVERPPEPSSDDVVEARQQLLDHYARHEARWFRRNRFRDALVERLRPLGVRPARRGTSSVVILGGDDPAPILATLASVDAATRVPHDVVIVGDGEAVQAAIRPLKADRPRLRLQLNAHPPGWAKRFNQGLAQANGDFVAVLRADTRVRRGWLGRLQWWADRGPQNGLLVPVEGEPIAEDAAELQPWRPDAGAGAMLLTRGVLDRVGGLDVTLDAGVYDVHDFLLRVRIAGFKLQACPDVGVERTGEDVPGPGGGDPARFEQRWGLTGRPDGAYDAALWDGVAYDRGQHHVAFGAEEGFRPDARPIRPEATDGRILLVVPPNEPAALRALVAALRDQPGDGCAVVARADHGRGDSMRDRLAHAAGDASLPDVVVVDPMLAPDREAGLYTGADAIYLDESWPGADRTAQRAVDCGRRLVRGPDALAEWFREDAD